MIAKSVQGRRSRTRTRQLKRQYNKWLAVERKWGLVLMAPIFLMKIGSIAWSVLMGSADF